MRVAAHLEHNQHKHEERHEEVQAVKLRDAAEHERDNRDAAIRVAILACKKEARQHIEDARCKSRRRDNGHHPLAIGHVHEGVGTAQMEHDNVQACKETETVYGGKVICWFRHFGGKFRKNREIPRKWKGEFEISQANLSFFITFFLNYRYTVT